MSSGGSSVCNTCVAGTWSAAESSECTACATGKYSGPGWSACTSCGGGKYRVKTDTGTESSACSVCGHGKYSTGTVNSCTNCDAGYYIADNGNQASEHDSSSDCDKCGSGKYSAAGASGCTDCEAGKYSEFSNNDPRTSCRLCPVGTFAIGGRGECSVCGPGRYRNTAGAISASECTVCPTGRYNIDGNSAASDNDALTDCDICGSGTANPNTGSNSAIDCEPCTAGTIAATSELASCSACAAGRYQVSEGQVTCEQCKSGKYANGAKTGCVGCSAGKISSAGGDGEGACTACVAGKYTTTGTSCENCISGKYSLQQATTCTNCPKGKYYDGTQGTSSAVCQNCARGTYAATTGLSSCAPCEAGTYDPDVSATPGNDDEQDCTVCPSGRYSLETDTNRQDCTECARGKYLSDSSNVYNRRTEHNSATDCLNCEAGEFFLIPACSSLLPLSLSLTNRTAANYLPLPMQGPMLHRRAATCAWFVTQGNISQALEGGLATFAPQENTTTTPQRTKAFTFRQTVPLATPVRRESTILLKEQQPARIVLPENLLLRKGPRVLTQTVLLALQDLTAGWDHRVALSAPPENTWLLEVSVNSLVAATQTHAKNARSENIKLMQARPTATFVRKESILQPPEKGQKVATIVHREHS